MGRPMTPGDLLRIKFVSDPQVSPDGSRVAFVVTTLSEDKDAYLANIWVVDASGGEARCFTTGPKRDTTPRWSPDGSRLAFLSEREPKKKAQLYVMPADGGEPTRLTDIKAGVSAPGWSPDGTRLAFVSRVGGWQEPESEEERQKSRPARVITTLKYKSNGEGFVHDRRPHLFVVTTNGGEPRQITEGDFDDGDPSWSPDGKLIAFASARHEDRDYDNIRDVWVVSPEGDEPRRVTDTAGPLSLPVFSPDGRTIACFGDRHVNEAGWNTRLFAIGRDGGTPTCLTADLDRNCVGLAAGLGPLWSPDGAWILFGVEDQGGIPALRVRADASAAPVPIIGGDRQVTGLSVSRLGAQVAFTATDPVSPAEVFVCGLDGTGERRLTDLNASWKTDVSLSVPERFRFERGGHSIDCWVMKPPAFELARRYPTLLNIHGGPHSQYGHAFVDELQVQAGAGYVVVYANPRGSQGYGEAFTRAVIGDWGGGDYADVMAALDEAIRRFDCIDVERLGVLGGSYGGFMTSWIVGHTGRFKAACSDRAVNNQHSMFGTSDIGHSFTERQSGCLPWDNPKQYAERSPISYVKDITTPLLIIHSEDDLRCPMEQAEQLFVALKKLRKEVVFVRFPDENHELSRSGRPRHRLERFRFVLEWFDKHLPH